jgi:hypothetical protein
MIVGIAILFATGCGSDAPQGKNGNAWSPQTQRQAVELAIKNLTAAERKNVCAVFRTDPDRVWAGFSTEHSDNQDGWVTRKNYDETMQRLCK